MGSEKMNEVKLKKQILSDIVGITNARQLGGYVNTEGRKIKQNILLRTGVLGSGTENDLKLLSEKYKVSNIVDFRTDMEMSVFPDPDVKGAVYEQIPLDIAEPKSKEEEAEFMRIYAKAMHENDAEGFLRWLIKNDFLPSPELYISFTEQKIAVGYRKFFDILLNKSENTSVLFHCTQGKDRTGVAAALLLYALDFDDETIMRDYLLTNEANKKLITADAEAVSKSTDDIKIIEKAKLLNGVSEKLLCAFLDKVRREYKSVKEYLRIMLKLSESDIARLKDIYLE